MYPTDAVLLELQEEMFFKIKQNINAKVDYCASWPWHGIHLTLNDICEAYFVIIQTRGSLVWSNLCKNLDVAWLSKADGRWFAYVHTTYKSTQVTPEQCRAFVQGIWEALPGAAVTRRQGTRKRVTDNEEVPR